MGVPARVVIYSTSPEEARDNAAAAFSRIGEIEQALSDYRPDSEAAKLCSQPVGVPTPLGPDLFAALRTAEHISLASGGALDVTVGPATRLWREARRAGHPPAEDQVRAARDHIGWQSIKLDEQARTATLTRPDLQLDFGAIGKGMAAQAAVDELRRRGTPRCLVAIAGDIAAGRPPPRGRGWTIDSPGGGTLVLTDAAISTSGDTNQYLEFNGRRYSHIIDPRTAEGIADRRVVSVVAPRGELADGLSTAACILGPEGTGALLGQFPGAGAIFIESETLPVPVREVDPWNTLPRLRPGAQ